MPAPLESLIGALGRAFRSGSALADDAETAALCHQHVAGNERLTPVEQADIYRRQFWLRHVDALIEDYPGVSYLIGEGAFDVFCRAYLEAHPPTSFTLRDLGNDIARFAVSYDGFPSDRQPIARDMARYEHALIDLFDGAAPPPLDPTKVTSMPEDGWSTARIVLHPLLVLMQLSYPVHAVRSELKLGRTPELPAPRPVHLAVFRGGLVIRYEELDPTAFALLEALGRGVPLVPACDAAAADLDEAAGAALAASLGTWFNQWTSWGLIVDIVPTAKAAP